MNTDNLSPQMPPEADGQGAIAPAPEPPPTLEVAFHQVVLQYYSNGMVELVFPNRDTLDLNFYVMTEAAVKYAGLSETQATKYKQAFTRLRMDLRGGVPL